MNQINYEEAGLFKDEQNSLNSESACKHYKLVLNDGNELRINVAVYGDQNYISFNLDNLIPGGAIYSNYNKTYGKLYYKLNNLGDKYNNNIQKAPTQNDVVTLVQEIKKAYEELKNYRRVPVVAYEFGGYYFTLRHCNWNSWINEWITYKGMWEIPTYELKELQKLNLIKINRLFLEQGVI